MMEYGVNRLSVGEYKLFLKEEECFTIELMKEEKKTKKFKSFF